MHQSASRISLLFRMSRNEIPSYRSGDTAPLVAVTEPTRASDIKILIEDPCQVVEASLRDALGTVSSKAVSASPETEIRELLAEYLEPQDLAQLRVLTSGRHVVQSGIVVALNSTQVTMTGEGILILVGKTKGVARGSVRVIATDDAQLNCHDNVHVDAGGRAKVNSFDHVIGIARDNARGTVRGNSQWTVTGNAVFDSHDNATIFGAGKAILRAYGRSRLRARGNCKATLCDTTQGWFVENTEVEVAGGAICYAQNQVRVAKKSPNSRVNRFPSEQRLEVFAWAYHTDRDGASLCVQL